MTILLALLTLPALGGRVWFPGRVAMTDGEVLEYPRVFALHYGEAYYEQWPLRLDSPILLFLDRDVEAGSGETAEDFRMLFDTGFSPDDFFEPMSDMDFGW